MIFSFVFADRAIAQQNGDEQEVYLTFRYQSLFNIYVTAYYVDGEFLLPHTELFRALQIDANADLAASTVSGQFLNEGYYEINYQEGSARFKGRTVSLPPDTYMIKELDFFLHPIQFYELFDLDFNVDFNNLSLRLETDKTMPILAQRERGRERERAMFRERDLYHDYYPLQFDRERSVFNAGFLDYNLSANITPNVNSYVFSTGIGTELLGGDFQGNVFGNWSQNNQTLRSNNLRWRYGIRDTPVVTRITAGQTTSNGLSPAPFTGIQITNEPIEPRFMYDDYVFSGTTAPDSEVELYRNNTLIDFRRADEMGNYRFQVPLTYGTSQYNLRMYTPSGQVSEQSTRMQIPFDFIPPGEVNYTLNAGRLDNPLLGTVERAYMAKGKIGVGLTNWLSLSGGTEYYDGYHDTTPTYHAALSTRVLSKYLFKFEAAPEEFYRVNASVVYPSSASVNVNYTHFNRIGGLYNPSQIESQLRANLFTPFQLGSLPLFFRWSVNHEQRLNNDQTRYRIDLNTRFGPFNLRFGYRDSQIGRLDWITTPSSRLTATSTFNIRRSANTPSFLQGAFIRMRSNYAPHINRIEDAELQFSRSIFRQGRLQFAAGHNFLGDFQFFRLNFSFDFNRIRTNSTARGSRGNANLTQSIRGSVALDSKNGRVTMSNRQQVGRSGLAVRMFVDENDNSFYDEGEELLEESAVRIERAGGVVRNVQGITYITQLQPYRQYNLMVNKANIRNPLLVPKIEQFSFVSDPNQFKTIDIPLYMSGVIEGRVQRQQNETLRELSGVRLYLNEINLMDENNGHSEELRTFSDGSFYAFEIPPAEYELFIDPSQLDFLNGVSRPEKHEFEVRSLREGDFVDGLDFTVVTEGPPEPDEPHSDPIGAFETPSGPQTISLQHNIQVDTLRQDPCFYQLQIGVFSTLDRANAVATEANQETGVAFSILYYPQNEQYAVRTHELSSFSRAIARARQFDDALSVTEYAVLNRCRTSQEQEEETDLQAYPADPAFELQLAAFSSRSNAEQYLTRIVNRFSIDAYITQAPGREVYRVRTGPYPDEEQAREAADKLRQQGVAEEFYLASTEPQPQVQSQEIDRIARPTSYEYRLQVGNYQTRQNAVLDAIRLKTEFDFDAYILVDDENRNNLLLDMEFESWAQLLETRVNLTQNNGFQRPILHLIER
ncbi:MAG: SPOR domain-containing protein [Balneolaceae bacterium]